MPQGLDDMAKQCALMYMSMFTFTSILNHLGMTMQAR